jgi:hypothetical protein
MICSKPYGYGSGKIMGIEGGHDRKNCPEVRPSAFINEALLHSCLQGLRGAVGVRKGHGDGLAEASTAFGNI